MMRGLLRPAEACGSGDLGRCDRAGKVWKQTYSTEAPSSVERTLILDHFFQIFVYGLEFNERRNEKPAIVCLARVDFIDARGRSAFERALKEVVFPMGW